MKRELSIPFLLSVAVPGYGILALISPENFLRAGVLAIAAACMALAYLFPATFLGVAVLSAVFGPEYQLEWFGIAPATETRSLLRLILLIALAVNFWRFGWVWRSNPPLVALLVMFLITLVAADFLPVLTPFQMVKSLIGLMLPFLFLHCLYRREAIDRYLILLAVASPLSVVLGLGVDAAGGFPAGGEVRVGGMTIPAYLGHFAFMGFFVSIYQYLDANRRRDLLLAGINVIVVLATASRTSIAMTAVLATVVTLFAPQQSFQFSARVKVSIAGALLLAGALVVFLPQVLERFENAGAKGRDRAWPYIVQAIEENPWFGRGIGAGAIFLDTVDDAYVNISAAHNEYLRFTMDAGIVGLLIFVAAMVWWVRSELRFMRREEHLLFLTLMLMMVLASIVDNTLTSPPALIFFFTLALIIQRARERGVEVVRDVRASEDRSEPALQTMVTKVK